MRSAPISCSILIVGSIALVGCGDEPAPTSQAKPDAPAAPTSERERLINNTQAASAVGYDGDAVKRSVQGMVNTTDRQQQQLDEATKAAGSTPSASDPDAAK
jgi:hypothetical protein